MKTSENKENKQLRELSEEELKEVTGGSKIEYTCPDGRKVSSMEKCRVVAY